MNRKLMAVVVVTGAMVVGLAGFGLTGKSFAGQEVRGGTITLAKQAESEYPLLAKVTLNQAIKSALGSTPGKVLKAGLEDEDGFLVYGVEVVTPDKAIMEVKVDAGSGKVLATSPDKADDEDDEDNEADDREKRTK